MYNYVHNRGLILLLSQTRLKYYRQSKIYLVYIFLLSEGNSEIFAKKISVSFKYMSFSVVVPYIQGKQREVE